jgi:hypothetical protein
MPSAANLPGPAWAERHTTDSVDWHMRSSDRDPYDRRVSGARNACDFLHRVLVDIECHPACRCSWHSFAPSQDAQALAQNRCSFSGRRTLQSGCPLSKWNATYVSKDCCTANPRGIACQSDAVDAFTEGLEYASRHRRRRDIQ